MNTPLVTLTSNASFLVDVAASSTASNEHDCEDDSSIATNSSTFFVAEEDDESFFSYDLSCKVDPERSPSSVPRFPRRRHALPVLLRRHNKLEGDSLFPNKEQQEVDNGENDDDDEEDSVMALLRNCNSSTDPNHKSWSDKALDQMDWEGADWEGDMVIEIPLQQDDDDDDDSVEDVEDAERGGYKNQHRNKESSNNHSSKRLRYSHRQERQSHRYNLSRE
jgi:hypothetical protein